MAKYGYGEASVGDAEPVKATRRIAGLLVDQSTFSFSLALCANAASLDAASDSCVTGFLWCRRLACSFEATGSPGVLQGGRDAHTTIQEILPATPRRRIDGAAATADNCQPFLME